MTRRNARSRLDVMRDSPPGSSAMGGVHRPGAGIAPPAVRMASQAASLLLTRARELLTPQARAEPAAASRPEPSVFPRLAGEADGRDEAAGGGPVAWAASAAGSRPAAKGAPARAESVPGAKVEPPIVSSASASDFEREAELEASPAARTPPRVSGWTLRDRAAEWSERFTGRFGEVWWIGSGDPITLRLPRGVTVLVITGVVGIIAMAFAAGRRSGPTMDTPVGAAYASAQADRSAEGLPPISFAEGVPGGAELATHVQASDAGVLGFERLQARFDAGLDPRVDGLNYLIYMTATRRECLRLADFLGERGVQAIVMRSSRSVHSAGADGQRIELPLYWVVDVGQGFTRNEYLRGEHEDFRAERMEFGRAWKRFNGDRGSDLADMQFYAYRASASPPPSAG